MIDDFLENAVDDSMFETALDLRKSAVKSIPPEGSRLPDVARYEVGQAAPSLVLAYSIYGDVDEESDLIDRNGIGNPWAVAGTIEVLQ